ncbi:hypothetical protein EVAR_16155_1 [Eumeta japonica]|uniref:Uncharacterized protein n=1 Tax=Eumeta variegata TaxID=151549 RepID=A0A4C1WAS6_EUMVA|nr:hypothetical protein EVAR_16155_1 [Eumeta japonica]
MLCTSRDPVGTVPGRCDNCLVCSRLGDLGAFINIDSTIVFDSNPILNFGPGPSLDSDSGSVLDSVPRSVLNSVSVTSHSSDLNEAGELCIKCTPPQKLRITHTEFNFLIRPKFGTCSVLELGRADSQEERLPRDREITALDKYAVPVDGADFALRYPAGKALKSIFANLTAGCPADDVVTEVRGSDFGTPLA